MVNQDLLEEVRYQKAIGRSPTPELKRELFARKYSPRDIEEAIAIVYQNAPAPKPSAKKESFMPKPLPVYANTRLPLPSVNAAPEKKVKVYIWIIIAAILAIILLFGIYYMLGKKPAPIQPRNQTIVSEDYEITLTSPSEVLEKENITFTLTFSEIIGLEQIEVTVTRKVLDKNDKEIAEFSTEELTALTIQNNSAEYTRTINTESLPSGTYSLELTTKIGKIEKHKSNEITISKTQTAQKVCTSDSNCADNNACTADSCSEGICFFADITPCCGNGICEAGETKTSCQKDCTIETNNPEGLTDQDVINKALALAKSSPTQAVASCSSISLAYNKNVCFLQSAQNTSSVAFCAPITDTMLKDDCYLALANKQNQACNKITDAYKRDTCVMLLRIVTA